jgi:transcriptional regulator with XRE-family HTH domain
MRLGDLIKEKRETQGLKQQDLSKVFGYTSGQYISNWERRKSNPPNKIAKQLCEILKIKSSTYQKILIDEFKRELERAFR